MISWKRLRAPCLVGTLALLTLGVGTASADMYTLNIDHCSGGCGTGPYGNITVQDVAGGEVQVTATLNSGYVFINTGLTTLAFNTGGNSITDYTQTSTSGTFNLTNGTTSVASGTTAFTLSPGTVHEDGFGDFQFGLECTSCATGGSQAATDPTSVTFDISGNFTAADLATLSTKGSPNVFFAADVCELNSTATGCSSTGPVGAGGTSSVPEPTAIILLGSSMIGLGAIVRRRRSSRLA